MKTLTTILGTFALAALSGCVAPLEITEDEIQQIYREVLIDTSVRSVYINKKTSTLILTRRVYSKAGQANQAKSWCRQYPQFYSVHIYDLSGDRHMGGALCGMK